MCYYQIVKKFKFEKLVRDNILSNILNGTKTNKVNFKILNNKQFLISLKKKFDEELKELDLNNKEDAIKELADLQLIIDTCLKTLEINKKEFREIAKNKNKKAGKFNKRIYIKNIEIDEKDEWFDYYVKKYKEIK